MSDPFTAILRAVIGEKMVEGAKQAYNTTRDSVSKFFSDWDAALKADYAAKNSNSNSKKSTKTSAEAVAELFERNGTTNTDPLAGGRASNTKSTSASSGTSNKSNIFDFPNTSQSNSSQSDTGTNTPTTQEDDTDVVTYTYKPGDTFGQVLLNLGLSDGSHLWGQGGDVEYYAQQLAAQGMLDERGNVKIGTPFKLRRRK